MSKKKQYPFDLQRALNGDKLVTRDGQKVSFFKKRASSALGAITYPYEALIEGLDAVGPICYTLDGKYWGTSCLDHEYDLFMSEPEPARYPFDEKRALAGEPLITRSGVEVTGFKRIALGGPYVYEGVIGRSVFASSFVWDGKFWHNGESVNDLFMKNPPAVTEGPKIEVNLKPFSDSWWINEIASLARYPFGQVYPPFKSMSVLDDIMNGDGTKQNVKGIIPEPVTISGKSLAMRIDRSNKCTNENLALATRTVEVPLSMLFDERNLRAVLNAGFEDSDNWEITYTEVFDDEEGARVEFQLEKRV